ncbi:hypothetical protein GQ54DRAFT_265015 [Martensiomyces pterosporus]|nr:hypothetical protein GQ54DRAFT_265015 [Martensiomyces pterosporus]
MSPPAAVSCDGAAARHLRNAPLVEPTIARFPLRPALPRLLADLNVPLSTEPRDVTLQYSVHACPRRIKREIGLVFPDIVGRESELLFIPTFQKTKSSMLGFQGETAIEKDDKLHLFYRWGAELVERLRNEGYWADITDPMSGMALFTTCGPSPYPDVEGAEVLLRYTPFNVGNCFILTHPHWGTHIYPATAFTLAPIGVARRILAAMQADEKEHALLSEQ